MCCQPASMVAENTFVAEEQVQADGLEAGKQRMPIAISEAHLQGQVTSSETCLLQMFYCKA